MESDIQQTHIFSPYFDKSKFQKQLELIKKASEVAQDRIDYASAHDDHILHAVEVVEDFLRKKHRLCDGGQAINAHLPAKYKFYDPEYSIPDYDFFTPSSDADIAAIVKDLRKAGFTDISAREGMHEGTTKIYVDYIPVADITEIDPSLYRILSKREFRNDGISYLDVNTLRMLMYLELSRPRGEVGRWEKVFERLLLLNEFSPVKKCKSVTPVFKTGLQREYAEFTLDYIINNKRVFAGADLSSFYQEAVKHNRVDIDWIFGSRKPIMFYSSTPREDALYLSKEFTQRFGPRKALTIKSVSSKGIDTPPPMEIICYGKSPLVFIIHESECHSYINVPVGKGKVIRIASMDTLITLYFSLGLVKSSYFDVGAMECLANQLVHINNNARRKGDKFIFPFISINCSGHQTSLPSLIRAKVKRITKKKAELKKLLQLSNTVRSSNNARNTRKH
jgi:Poly(A) polymerase catalytic subunit